MTLIPGTTTTANFIGFEGPHAPLFYDAVETGPTMGSVNAGNQQLWVGGGGINRGFEAKLASSGQTTSEYVNRHNQLFAATDPGDTGTSSYEDRDPIGFSSFINDPVAHDDRTGLSFVDVFGDALPRGNVANAAMIYATPPDGRTYPTRDHFLADIEATACKLVRSVAAYNASAGDHDVPRLQAVRMCLYSSGIFNAHFDDDGSHIERDSATMRFLGKDGTEKPKVSLDVIALRIYDGLVTGLNETPSGLTEIQFPFSPNPADPLFNAVRMKLAQNEAAPAGPGDAEEDRSGEDSVTATP